MISYFPIMLYLLIPFIILVFIIVGIVAFFNNRNSTNNMDPNQTRPKTTAKDFFLNLGAFIAFYTLVGSLIDLLFTVIDKAYPQIVNNYYGSSSISWPVSILVVFFPIFILLMWFLEREYRTEPDMQNSIVHRGLTYITLFVSSIVIAGDLITVVYYFIDGQELTTGFILKVLVLLILASSIFVYYISDIRRKLTPKSRIFWRILAGVIIVGSIIWGFSVLGSPRTQQLFKYDTQKVNDLQSLNSQVNNYYSTKGTLPKTIEEMSAGNYYVSEQVDAQTKKPYEYEKISDTTYNLCAEFNKASDDKNNIQTPMYNFGDVASWSHPAGHYCFKQTVNPNLYPTKVPANY